jgi:MoxR-like ATPase
LPNGFNAGKIGNHGLLPEALMNNIYQTLNNIVANAEKVIIGKRDTIAMVLISLICNGHVLVEDVPGVGKTSLVSAVAKSINASFSRIQFTPDTLPSDITGFSIYNMKSNELEYKQGAVFSQFVLADEINRTSPKTQASLLEVMEEAQVTVDGTTYKMPRPFMVLATQNPAEYIGTYPLPESQLDRFFMKLKVGYPTAKQESRMLTNFKLENPLEKLESVASPEDIIEIQEQVRKVFVDDSINDYIVSIVTETRKNPNVELGVSPRGTLALYRAAQAWALCSGRDFVMPDDIIKVAQHVLNHRIMTRQEARLRNITSFSVINEAIERVKVPLIEKNA